MGTKITGSAKRLVAKMDAERRGELLSLLYQRFLPDIEAKQRERAGYGITSGGTLSYKVPKKLTGERYRIFPGAYCDVVATGDGRLLPSVVVCDIDELGRGARRLIKALEEMGS